MEAYEIQEDGRHVAVRGRLQDNGQVEVTVDGETYTYTTADGRLDAGAVSMTLHAEDGAVIDEGAVSQEITLPDGTYISKGAASERVQFSDGQTIESTPADGEGGVQISITTGGTKMVQSVDVSGETTIETTQQQTREVSSGGGVEAPDIIGEAAVLVFFGGLLAGILFNVIEFWGAVVAAAFTYYALKIGHKLYVKWGRDEEESEDEELTVEEQIEELRDDYLDDDGDINSLDEYEDRVEQVLAESDREDVEVEVERTTA